MSSELHLRAKEILLAALELERESRLAWVESECDGDRELFEEVRSLLAADDSGDDLLDRSPMMALRDYDGPTVALDPGPAPIVLRRGDLLAGRFELGERLGEGGMGVVFAARDRELDADVALKVLRPASRSGGGRATADWRGRFRREVQLARRVTHPNVCRIYELFRHPPEEAPPAEGSAGPATEDDVLAVLSMELLAGRTLAEAIDDGGPMDPEVVLALLRQMAAGLDAAHDAGVVHRDFKSSNVMLVPAEATADASGSGTRVVITDFGIARALESDRPSDATLTATGQLVGTPSYMAPEQLLGEPVSAASDVYALGVVIFEMLTGRRPFEAATPLSAAARRLTERPARLDRLRPDLDARWRHAIERCLERDPADRFQRASQLVEFLEGKAVARPAGRQGRRRETLRAAGLLLVVLVGALGALWMWRGSELVGGEEAAQRSASAAVAARAGLAVRPLLNRTGDERLDWWSVALAEMLSAELESSESLRVAPVGRVAELEREMGLAAGADESSPTAASLVRLAEAIGSDLVVSGEFHTVDRSDAGRIRLDLSLAGDLDRLPGSVPTITELGSESELTSLVERAAKRLRASLGVADPSRAQRAAALARLPSSSEAARLYTQGMEHLRSYDPAAARDFFVRTVEAEPGFALGHLALAEAWSQLGFELRAQEAAGRAYELREPLQRAEQLWIEGRYRGLMHDWQRAADIYRALFTVYPDRLEFGLRLARAQIDGGDGEGALQTVTELRRLDSTATGHPQIDVVEAYAAWAASDWQRYEALLGRAAERSEALGLRGTLAEVRCDQGWGQRYQARLDLALETALGCREAWRRLGNPAGESAALNLLATIRLDRGELEEAAAAYLESASIDERMGNLGGVAVAYSNLGNVRYEASQLRAAGEIYAQARDLYRQLGRRDGVAMMGNGLGNVSLALGEIERALAQYGEALSAARDIGARRIEALALNNLGNTQLAVGDLVAAARSYELSIELCRELDHPRLLAYDLYGLGEVAAARGDPATAVERHREALDSRVERGEELTAEESRLALARLELAAGGAEAHDAVARAARSAAVLFAGQGAVASQASALALESRALVRLGRRDEARRSAERALELAEQAGRQVPLLEARLALALTSAAAEEAEVARQTFAAVEREARSSGLLPLALEAAVLAATAELELGEDRAGAERRLRDLESEARERGLAGLAERAASAAAR